MLISYVWPLGRSELETAPVASAVSITSLGCIWDVRQGQGRAGRRVFPLRSSLISCLIRISYPIRRQSTAKACAIRSPFSLFTNKHRTNLRAGTRTRHVPAVRAKVHANTNHETPERFRVACSLTESHVACSAEWRQSAPCNISGGRTPGLCVARSDPGLLPLGATHLVLTGLYARALQPLLHWAEGVIRQGQPARGTKR